MDQKIENKRKIPKQDRSRALYNDILDATIRVLEEEGFGRTTTTRIADRAGISAGSLYQYFANKEHIFRALSDRRMRHLDDRLASIAQSNDQLGLISSLALLIDAVLEKDKQLTLLAEIHAKQYNVPLHPAAEQSRQIFGHVEKLLERHTQELRDGVRSPDAAFILVSLIEAGIKVANQEQPEHVDAAEVTRELKHMLRSYISGIRR